MKRILMIIAAAILAALSMPALSADLIESFAPSTEAVTPNSACGAVAVGRSRRTGQTLKGQHRDVEAGFGQYVTADGIWDGCELPTDCRSVVLPTVRDTDRLKTVYGTMPQALPDAYANAGAESTARVKIYTNVTGASGRVERIIRGHALFVCDGAGNPAQFGGWTLKRAALPWNQDALGAPGR